MTDFFWTIHRGLPRQGPGDFETTREALALVGPLPGRPLVLDLGCGPGAQTLDLAALLPDARIAALDLHPPFVTELRQRAAAAGISGRVLPVVGNMARPPFPEERFDLLWSEGAAYVIGFEDALTTWRTLLKPDGVLAVSEIVRLRPELPPEPAKLFEGYPALTDAEGLRAVAARAGYEVVGDFVLREDAWWADYYRPLEARLGVLAREHHGDGAAMAAIAASRAEIDAYRRHSSAYGYLFLVMRRPVREAAFL